MILNHEHPIPEDLCGVHRTMWIAWRKVTYDIRHPCEWPGGSIIMDSRTSHTDREAGWDRKTLEQMALIESICRRGDSAQCGER